MLIPIIGGVVAAVVIFMASKPAAGSTSSTGDGKTTFTTPGGSTFTGQVSEKDKAAAGAAVGKLKDAFKKWNDGDKTTIDAPVIALPSTPTPGAYYAVKAGDKGAVLAAKCYGLPKPFLVWLRVVASAPNQAAPLSGGTQGGYGPGQAWFYPHWDKSGKWVGKGGGYYAVIWWPPTSEVM